MWWLYWTERVLAHYQIPRRQHRSSIPFAILRHIETGRVEIVWKLGLE
jgi:hypothetical protein